MAAKVPRKVLYLLILCQLCGIGIFMKGFFPLKKITPGYSKINTDGAKVRQRFDRLILIMIDALRADFVFTNKSYMPFTTSMIDQGETFSFVAHAHPPTVTMPRIKAITTGTIPGFIDFIINLASNNLLQDNIITQMKMAKLKINFFGDDTWIKLFPQHFQRADGTTSFFVTDFTQVDNNVTRHLEHEMVNDDWDVTILHYLGLDHIGHLSGPFSPLIKPKLYEMDNILKNIYKSTVEQDRQRNITTLVILCGDHGMNDGGSHGGSSQSEIKTPLVFMSSEFEKQQGQIFSGITVNQIDLAPTLSLLMGLSIPKNSAGVLINDLFADSSIQQHLEALRMNALQLSEVFKTNSKDIDVVYLSHAIKLHEELLTIIDNSTYSPSLLKYRASKVAKMYLRAMQVMSDRLKKSMASYDYYALYIGIWLLLLTMIATLCVWFDVYSNCLPLATTALVFFLTCILSFSTHFQLCSTQYSGNSDLLCSSSMYSVLLYCTVVLLLSSLLTFLIIPSTNFIYSNGFHRILELSGNLPTNVLLVFGVVLHNVSLFSSSFIEEEHQTWYFITTTFHLSILYFNFRTRLIKHYSDREGFVESCNRRDDTIQSTSYKMSDLKESGMGSVKSELLIMVILLCSDKFLRSWNQTGIKWIDQPDISHWFLKPENKLVLTSLVMLTLISICTKVYIDADKFTWITFSLGCIGVYLYRDITGSLSLVHTTNEVVGINGIPYAQFVHLCVLLIVASSLIKYFGDLYHAGMRNGKQRNNKKTGIIFLYGYILLILLLVRPHNIPLVGIGILQVYIHQHYVWKNCETTSEIVLSAYFMGWFTYFSQGKSNSLASVDVAAGYIGLQQEHSPIFTAVLLNLSTFSGPLFWLINCLLFLINQEQLTSFAESRSRELSTILLFLKTTNVAACACMSWLSCYHLFVWSVFSPKLFYETVISFVLAFFIIVVSIVI